MKTKEEKLEDLVSTRLFEDLSEEERQFVLEALGSEEQFTTLQRIHTSLHEGAFAASVEPALDVLNSLKSKIREEKKESFFVPALLQFKIPAYAALLLAVITAFVASVVSSGSLVKERPVPVSKLQIDTVYLTKTDTLYREKQVTHYIRVPVQAEPLMVTASAKSDRPLGVSMKDKEELDKFLVSGLN